MPDERTARTEASLIPAELRLLRGPWSLRVVDDEVVDVRHHGLLVLAGTRAVVRDRDWNTASITVHEIVLRHGDASSTLTLHGHVQLDGLSAKVITTVTASEHDITVTTDLLALSTFLSNRLGLVVLHPLDLAGTEVLVTHPDGSSDQASFPRTTSPHQPFRDIRELVWQQQGMRLSLRLEGDIFETEDQRNWTDASYKTYSGSVDAPFPVLVTQGTHIRHQAVLTAEGRAGESAGADALAVDLETAPTDVVPVFGTSLTAAASGPSGLASVLVEVELTDHPEAAAVLREAAFAATEMGAALDVRLVCAGSEELSAFLRELPVLTAGCRIVALGAFDVDTHVSELPLWEQLVAVRGQFPGTLLLAGTRGQMAELNRTHERLVTVFREADAVAVSVTPQMHTTETRHVVANLEGQRHLARDAAAIAVDKPLLIGPITMRRRFNAVATERSRQHLPLSATLDPRQRGDFAATWTVASAICLTGEGTHTLSYATTDDLIDSAGETTPVGSALRLLSSLSGRPASRADTRDHPGLHALVVHTQDAPRVLVANLASSDVVVRASGKHLLVRQGEHLLA